MGFLFRRRRRGGDKGYLPNWYIRFADAQGRWHEEAGFTDKGRSKQLLREREDDAEAGRLNHRSLWRKWERLPLWDDRGQSHVGAYLAHLRAKGDGEGHRLRIRQHLVRAFEEMGAMFVAEVTAGLVEQNLVGIVESGRSAQTRNHRLSALRGLWKWGIEAKRFRDDSDPTRGLKALKAEAARVRARRALTIEELRALVEAARTRPLARYLESHPDASEAKRESLRLAGIERATLYTLAAYSGLRKNELRQLRWGDVRLDAEEPMVVVRAATAKGKREEGVELAGSAVAALKEWRAELTRTRWGRVGDRERVFTNVPHNIVRVLWKDCAWARVECVGADGRTERRPIAVETQDGRVDLHSLRHTTATLLCLAGVPMPVAQRLMRHKDSRTTTKIYIHVSDSVRRAAVRRLPSLAAPEGTERAEGRA